METPEKLKLLEPTSDEQMDSDSNEISIENSWSTTEELWSNFTISDEKSHLITDTENTWMNLADYLHQYGPFPLQDPISAMIVRNVSMGLAELHARQIVHDAVFAENIFFSSDCQQVNLLIPKGASRKVNSALFVESISEDIFQLGCVFYRCLTGKYPKFDDAKKLVALEPQPFKMCVPAMELAVNMLAASKN